jgi:sugar porter (SP) family MFS transporter
MQPIGPPSESSGLLPSGKRPGLVYLIAMVAALGGFLFGYDLAIISGVTIILKTELHLTPEQLGLATGSALLGCMFGPILGGTLSDRLGRRRTLIVAGLLFAAGAVGSSLAPDLLGFNLFRVIGGLGVGLASVVSPMFIAEVAPARIRGALVTVNQLAIVVGLSSSVFVSYGLSFGEHWRWMLVSNAVPVPFLFAGLLLVPESPRWLMQKNRHREALDVLTRIDGRQNAESEIREILASTGVQGSFGELLRPGMRFALMIACSLAILQQVTGVSILFAYLPIIFQKAGFLNATDAIRQNMIVAIWNVICTVVAMLVVDRLGRRPLLLVGTLGMALGLTLTGAFFHWQKSGGYVVLTVLVSVGAYLVSLAPLTWLIMSEIFPNRLRGRAMGIASVCVWVASFLTTIGFPPMVAYFERTCGTPALAFWVFAAVSILAFLFCLVFVPETKGRTLEELGASWTQPGRQ